MVPILCLLPRLVSSITYCHLIPAVNDGLTPVSQVLTSDCSSIHWITPVYGFLGSTNKMKMKNVSLRHCYRHCHCWMTTVIPTDMNTGCFAGYEI